MEYYLGTTVPMYNSNRNLFYLPSGSTLGNAVGYSGGTQLTLANWQTKTGKDLLSATADPKFQNAATFILIPDEKSDRQHGAVCGCQQ